MVASLLTRPTDFSSILIFGLLFCFGYYIYGDYETLKKVLTTMTGILIVLGTFIMKKGNPLFKKDREGHAST